ncbi:MAG: hypothetical protein VX589_18040 [Myxococcota bacterium]|nr:hypothetical protein [Myxococcota bacterium]
MPDVWAIARAARHEGEDTAVEPTLPATLMREDGPRWVPLTAGAVRVGSGARRFYDFEDTQMGYRAPNLGHRTPSSAVSTASLDVAQALL